MEGRWNDLVDNSEDTRAQSCRLVAMSLRLSIAILLRVNLEGNRGWERAADEAERYKARTTTTVLEYDVSGANPGGRRMAEDAEPARRASTSPTRSPMEKCGIAQPPLQIQP